MKKYKIDSDLTKIARQKAPSNIYLYPIVNMVMKLSTCTSDDKVDIPVNTCFPTDVPTSWAKDHVAITGIFGIGREKSYSLCGGLGSQFMIDDWGYPAIGVAICDCPSAGHDMIFLDYRECGSQGEPKIVHIDQECDYKITPLADNFEEFIRGLVNEDDFELED